VLVAPVGWEHLRDPWLAAVWDPSCGLACAMRSVRLPPGAESRQLRGRTIARACESPRLARGGAGREHPRRAGGLRHDRLDRLDRAAALMPPPPRLARTAPRFHQLERRSWSRRSTGTTARRGGPLRRRAVVQARSSDGSVVVRDRMTPLATNTRPPVNLRGGQRRLRGDSRAVAHRLGVSRRSHAVAETKSFGALHTSPRAGRSPGDAAGRCAPGGSRLQSATRAVIP